ncbi:MAG: hydroxymethylglutaryl-CoA reductase [Flavobacterium sp.]
MNKEISGFSKLSKSEKIDWIAQQYFAEPETATQLIKKYWNSDESLQQLHDEFIENTITNFYLPLGVAPNVMINNHYYTVPMVIEESSVVAAAAKSAKFWAKRGGFKTTVLGTEKIGQVHFLFKGDSTKLCSFFEHLKPKLFTSTASLTANMQKRGGGILNIELRDKTSELQDYYQLHATFETKDSMGANFINSCLEQFAKTLKSEAEHFDTFTEEEKHITVVMSILSNYVNNCKVRAEVYCPIEELYDKEISDPKEFAEKFVTAVQIARLEPYRAVTHNKGIMNGISAAALAYGQDWRAIEAAIHSYTNYFQIPLVTYWRVDDVLYGSLEAPIAVGSVGGSVKSLNHAKTLMELSDVKDSGDLAILLGAVGLANNFGANFHLAFEGIQTGHMKLHARNIALSVGAREDQVNKIVEEMVKNKKYSYEYAKELLERLK